MFDRNKTGQQSRQESEAPATVSGAPEAGTSGNRSQATSGARANIGATIRIKGDVSGEENLLIEGSVEGTVRLDAHELVVGKSGKVHADLTAKIIRIDGEVHGDITGKEKVIISATGNVRGNIVTPRMTLEDGAKFKGSIDMDPGSSAEQSRKAPSPFQGAASTGGAEQGKEQGRKGGGDSSKAGGSGTA